MNASIGPPCTSRDSLTSTAICPANKRIGGGGGDSVSARVRAPERLALTALPRSDVSLNVQTASRLECQHRGGGPKPAVASHSNRRWERLETPPTPAPV